MILQGNITDALAVVQNIETCAVSMIDYPLRDENTTGNYMQMNLCTLSYHEVFDKETEWALYASKTYHVIYFFISDIGKKIAGHIV